MMQDDECLLSEVTLSLPPSSPSISFSFDYSSFSLLLSSLLLFLFPLFFLLLLLLLLIYSKVSMMRKRIEYNVIHHIKVDML